MVFVEVAVTNCDCAFPTVLLVLMGKGSLTGRFIFEKKLILIYKLHYIFTNYNTYLQITYLFTIKDM